jgi:hypothetical protein
MKKFYQSKTLWFNAVSVILLWIVPVIFPEFILQVPPEWGIYKAPVIAILNMVLRLITVQPIDSPLV